MPPGQAGTHYEDQGGAKLIEIYLPLPSECIINGTYSAHNSQSCGYIVNKIDVLASFCEVEVDISLHTLKVQGIFWGIASIKLSSEHAYGAFS